MRDVGAEKTDQKDVQVPFGVLASSMTSFPFPIMLLSSSRRSHSPDVRGDRQKGVFGEHLSIG